MVLSILKRIVPRLVAALLSFIIGVAAAAAMVWTIRHPAPPMDREVIGKWMTDPNDMESLQTHGPVNLDFNEDGRCVFTRFPVSIFDAPLLGGRVQKGIIVVDYPASIEGKIEYAVEPGGKLRLRFGSFQSTYIRVP